MSERKVKVNNIEDAKAAAAEIPRYFEVSVSFVCGDIVDKSDYTRLGDTEDGKGEYGYVARFSAEQVRRELYRQRIAEGGNAFNLARLIAVVNGLDGGTK